MVYIGHSHIALRLVSLSLFCTKNIKLQNVPQHVVLPTSPKVQTKCGFENPQGKTVA